MFECFSTFRAATLADVPDPRPAKDQLGHKRKLSGRFARDIVRSELAGLSAQFVSASRMSSISAARIAQIESRHNELQATMARGDLAADQFVQLSKDYAEIEPVARAAAEVRRLRAEAASLQRDDARCRRRSAADGVRRVVRERGGTARSPNATSRCRCCPRTPPTSARRSLKSAPAPAATRPRCSRATCSACTSASPRRAAGASR